MKSKTPLSLLVLPWCSDGKALACSAGDPGSIPGSGRFPWSRKQQPTPVLCLENPMDGGAWWATVHGVAKSRTRQSEFIVFSFFHHSYHLGNSKDFRRFVPGMRTKTKHTFLAIKHNTAEAREEQLWSEPRANSSEKGLEVGGRWWGWGGAERPLPERRKDRLEGKRWVGQRAGPWEGEGVTVDSCGLPAGWGRKPLRPPGAVNLKAENEVSVRMYRITDSHAPSSSSLEERAPDHWQVSVQVPDRVSRSFQGEAQPNTYEKVHPG